MHAQSYGATAATAANSARPLPLLCVPEPVDQVGVSWLTVGCAGAARPPQILPLPRARWPFGAMPRNPMPVHAQAHHVLSRQ